MAAEPRLTAASFLTVVVLSTFTACTVKPTALPYGTMPAAWNPTSGESEFGSRLFHDLCEEYSLHPDEQESAKPAAVLHQLAEAAGANVVAWHVHLFDEPEIVDIRAVHGNYIFVWSGLLNTVISENELAGMMAWEMAHAMARHTEPVQYTLGTEFFFRVAELATSIGIMMLSQGVVAVSGSGWMQWICTEAMALDPLDRVYSEDEEREAASIAVPMLEQANYSPQALLSFWQRVQSDPDLADRCRRLARKLPPNRRVAILQELLPDFSRAAAQSME